MDVEQLYDLPKHTLQYLLWRRKWLMTAREKQLPPDDDSWTELGVLAGRGFGKACCIDTPVPTPSGWQKLGDLAVGDQVFDEHGRPCRILEVFDWPRVPKAYELRFSDGTSVVACADHQWATWTHRDRKQFLRYKSEQVAFPHDWAAFEIQLFDKWGNVTGTTGKRVKSTKEIVDTVTFGKRGDTNHCIPLCGPLQYEPKDLIVDPWVLGYWLGNGARVAGFLSCHPEDAQGVRDMCSALGFEPTAPERGRHQYFTARGLQTKLARLGVLDNKHVPEAYLQGSVEQRAAVLAGLLDSDGHCDKATGIVEFCSTDKVLADNVVELARSLGEKPRMYSGRATLNGVDYGEKWRVCWRPTFNPFGLPRKAAAIRIMESQSFRNRHRMIVEAVEVDPEDAGPMRCLTVDSEHHMFLIGEGMIPTHNTLMGAQWLSNEAYRNPEKLPVAVIAPTLNDVRHTCFEGPAGILSVVPPELIYDYNKSNLIITMVDQTDPSRPGATIRGFSAEEPERLRGPQFSRLWCFPAGTMVEMADGSQKAIETVVVGDEVRTRAGGRRVLAAGVSANRRDFVRVSYPGSVYDSVTCTEDHRLMVNGSWMAAEDVRVGDYLRLSSGVIAPVVGVERLAKSGEVYDLTVEDEHEFFANKVLVHNCDESAAWSRDEETFDMAMMGLRLGSHPKLMWTTTPKPKDLIRKLVAPKEQRIIVRGSTYDNRANLPQSFFDQLKQYEGTQIGRQELEGELIDAEEGGVIQRSWLKLWPASKRLPAFEWIIMSLDTAFTEKTTGDQTACTVWGVFWNDDVREILLLDCWADHLGLPDLIKKVRKEMNVAYGDDEDSALIKPLIGPSRPEGSGRKPDILLIEDKGSGISLRQMLEREGIVAYAYNPGRADKLTRLHMVSHVFAQKMVWIPESENNKGRPKSWVEPMLAQLCSFSGEGSIRRDDYVDAVTSAVRLCLDKRLLDGVKRPKEERRREAEMQERRAPLVNPYAV